MVRDIHIVIVTNFVVDLNVGIKGVDCTDRDNEVPGKQKRNPAIGLNKTLHCRSNTSSLIIS